MFKLSRILVFITALAVALVSSQELYLRLVGEGLSLPVKLVDEAEKLYQNGRWAESKMLAEFVVEHPGLGDADKARILVAQTEERLNSFWGMAERFAAGAVTGEPRDTASMLGALSLDLFVIGDIRDLAVQGWKQYQNQNGDTVIMALSGVGLVTTLVPEIDWAPALLKALKRVGALSTRFIRSLKSLSRQALKTRRFGRLGAVVSDFGKAAKRLGPGPLSGIMKHVDDVEDLSRIARAAEFDAKGTYVVTRTFGKNGLRRISKDGRNIGAVVASIKTGSRALKIGRKYVRTVTTSGLVALLVLSVLLSLAALIPFRRRRRARPRRRLAPNMAPPQDDIPTLNASPIEPDLRS